ncbi:hypothetical protein Q428_14270 [Fervidicella metallireducens AeB]|uniref:Spore coat protein n=2 Tax=Fervidicella TaxID=1403538 RepID=A0A017RTN1_9CLOT|nr:hypothetical protein Q428_14270 [Fervidicella metallireducens AeB]
MNKFFICPFVSVEEYNRYRRQFKMLTRDESQKVFKAEILDFKQGDVNGDGFKDNVFLIGNKPYGDESPFVDNITLIIQCGRSQRFTRVNLKNDAGYNPTIFLGNFTNDRGEEILITIDTGGSGGTIYSYVYSFLNNDLKKIFDSDKFNDEYIYRVSYRDNFKVDVISKNLAYKYTLDIEYKGKEYLSEIYDDSGKLKEPIEGFVRPLGGLYSIDFNRDGVLELYAAQGISGRYGADGLGFVETILKWSGRRFEAERQYVAIFGSEIKV